MIPKELLATEAAKAELHERLVETELQLGETQLALREKERELEAYTAEMEGKMAASLSEASHFSSTKSI